MRSVLVTGAAGLVGGLTLKALSARSLQRLVGLDVRAPSGPLPPGVSFLEEDIRSVDFGALLSAHRIDTVVHLASILKPPRGQPRLAFEVDVLGTRRLLEACVATGVKRLVITTSGASYGYHPDQAPQLSEEDPLRGNEDLEYAHHKRLIEELLAEYRQRHPSLRQVIFRPGTILAEGVRTPVTELFAQPVMLGVAGHDSPFVFILAKDVVACIVEAVFGNQEGAFNLAGEGSLTGREIAARLNKPYLPFPAGVLRLAFGGLHALGLSPYGAGHVKFLQYRPVLSNAKLRKVFGYQPTPSREAFELYARSFEKAEGR